MHIFSQGIDNALWQKSWDGSRWKEWEKVGGQLASPPSAVSWAGNKVAIFGRGVDNAIWYLRGDRGQWSEWQSLGSALPEPPACVSWGAGRMDCFVRGSDGAIWHKWWNGAGGEDVDFQVAFPNKPTNQSILRVTSRPGSAFVHVDNQLKGKTSAEKGELILEDLSPDSHVLRLSAPGYKDSIQTVALTSAKTSSIEMTLVAENISLAVVSQPAGVQVYLDNKFVGMTSESQGDLVVEGTPGSHRLRLSLPGYKDWSQEVVLTAGDSPKFEARLVSAGPAPLTLQEVADALANGVSKARVTVLVKQFGVDFPLTDETEKRLRSVGADDALLLVISKARK